MQIRKWDMAQLSFEGTQAGNPFVDVTVDALARCGGRTVEVPGFYDGNGVYRVRILPDFCGRWQVTLKSNDPLLDGQTAEFDCITAADGVHGPVQVADEYHFAYADGTPYYECGTTCYVWNHQEPALREKTLATLKDAPFNKMRMCVFPKHYRYNANEPAFFPFEGNLKDGFDFTRFNPDCWAQLDVCVTQLMALGIEADIILFHPYDRWGFAHMDRETEDLYLRYCVARLSGYRNVWWSFANEFDFMRDKNMTDWDHYGPYVQRLDPVGHLRGIHNGRIYYDHTKPWVTHCSIQSHDFLQIPVWHERYHKPICIDECCYEGNIPNTWGNITAREMVHRFWESLAYGAYCGHGETYLNDRDELWWSKGGELVGQSPERLKFFLKIFSEMPGDYVPLRPGVVRPCIGSPSRQYLYYAGPSQSVGAEFSLPEQEQYQADIIDTWEMTVTPVPGVFSGNFLVPMPQKPYLAVRLRRVEA